jgi:NADH dehydrogenase FAD-containing subunit
MARVLILGGGFGGVVAAESLARQLGDGHQITLVSRSGQFLFYPALVRLAFGQSEAEDVSFDLRRWMLDRQITFIEGEVARINADNREVIIAHGDVTGTIPYDYLIFALGRRLATERVPGFFEHAHHLLDLDGALKLREAVRSFEGGRVIIGQCPDARLPVPVYESAFALARWLDENGDREKTTITIINPGPPGSEFEDSKLTKLLAASLRKRRIEYLPNLQVSRVTSSTVVTSDSHQLDYNLLMLLPPFRGSSVASRLGITSEDDYINVDWNMKVIGMESMYAVGDCVNFSGPKMGHLAVHQGEVAAANLAAEIAGHPPVVHYDHDLMTVIDIDGESIYFHKDLWANEPSSVRHGRFWSWAKRIHEKYWTAAHQ